jgi:hypothetical protein
VDYSPFHTIVWGSFFGFIIITWASVKLYHGKYPDYPKKDLMKGNHLAQTRDSEDVKTNRSGT